jgi:hypothetical protein
MKVKFIQAVDNNDIVSVRIFLANELMLDPRGESFRKMKSLAEAKIKNLYEPNNEPKHSTSETEWNENYLFTLKNDLDSNFSKEKLDLYERVAKFVLKDKATLLDKEEASQQNKQTSSHFKPKNHFTTKQKVYAGVAISSSVVAITGFCLSRMTLASLGVAGAVISGILLFNDSKK